MFDIEVLGFATQEVPGPQVFYQAAWSEWVTFGFYVLLLRSDDVVGLIDCGMDDAGPLNAAIEQGIGERARIRTSQGVTTLLASRGVKPEDVDFVAFTHLHADHVGNVAKFPHARFILSREGWQRHLRLLEDRPAMVADPAFPLAAMRVLRDEARERVDLVGDGPTRYDGLEVQYLGGHTADSAGFVVTTPSGRTVVPGDVVWTYRNLEEQHPVGSCVDLGQCYEALSWARSAGDLVFPSHDPAVGERYGMGRSEAGRNGE